MQNSDFVERYSPGGEALSTLWTLHALAMITLHQRFKPAGCRCFGHLVLLRLIPLLHHGMAQSDSRLGEVLPHLLIGDREWHHLLLGNPNGHDGDQTHRYRDVRMCSAWNLPTAVASRIFLTISDSTKDLYLGGFLMNAMGNLAMFRGLAPIKWAHMSAFA